MSLEITDDLVVKEESVLYYTEEEYFIEEANNEFQLQKNRIITPDPTQKCGEVYLGHRRTFTFVCSQCLQTFLDLCSFGEHIRDAHQLPTLEPLVSNAFHNDRDPLKLEPAETAKIDFGLRINEDEEDSQCIHDSHLEEETLQSNGKSLNPAVKKAKPKKDTHSKTYCCYTCGKIFLRFQVYRKHYYVEHPDMIEKNETNKSDTGNPKAFVPKIPEEMVCKYCLSTFDEPISYHKHMEFHHPSPKRFSCPYCPHRPYRHKNDRDYHLDMHDGTKRFHCPHCPKTFAYPRNLQTHVNAHKLPIVESLVSSDSGDRNPLKFEPADKDENDLDLCTDEVLISIDGNPLKSELVEKMEGDFDLRIDEEEGNPQGIHNSIDLSDDSHLEEETVQSNEESFTPAVEQATTYSKTYCCYTCGKIFVRFGVYRTHYSVEHPDMIEKDNTNETDPCHLTGFVPKIPEEMVCKYCLSTFNEPTNYHKHMEFDHPSPKRYTCPHCPRRPYRHKNDRDYHLDMHDGTRRFQCPHCPKAFTYPRPLQTHVNTHKLPIAESLVSNVAIGNTNPPADQVENDLDLRSDEVPISIGRNSMKSELADKVDTDFDLDIDKEESNSQGIHDSIDLSDDSHLEGDTVQCNKESLSKVVKKVKRQKKTHSKTYCCYTCGKIFIGFEVYHKHYRVEHPDMIEKDDTNETDPCNPTAFLPKIPEQMVCKYCLSTFDEPTNYHKHMDFDHPSPKRYTCPRCPHRPYRHKNSRDYHLDMHDGTRRFQCPHCPKRCSDPSYLQTHINIHLNIKPFSCKFCDQKYTQRGDLRIHERIHTKERPFQCDECGMSFIAQVMLTKHKRKHKNMRNYPCQHCDKAFYSSSDLNKHIRTHTRETPYSCPTCDQKFRTRSNLRSHELLHSDNKKYECKLCGKTFAQFPGLYSHMKSHGEVKKSLL